MEVLLCGLMMNLSKNGIVTDKKGRGRPPKYANKRDRLGFKQKIEDQYRYYVHSSGFDELHKGHNKKFSRNALISEG